MLMPTQHGNEARRYLDQDSYELTVANKLIFPALLSYSVWGTQTTVLTSRCWPKIKLPEGVQQISGQTMTYNTIPFTNVPKRGTVRFMSKSNKSFSAAMSQKGIGSEYEGSALNSPYGPQLIAMDIRAYAESIDQGMAINTAINMVNAAYRAPYLRAHAPFKVNFTQVIQSQIKRWACLGANSSRIHSEIEDVLAEYPRMNTLLMPDKVSRYVGSGFGKELPIYIYTVDESKDIIITQSPDRLLTKGSLAGGRVDAFDMPSFKIRSAGKAFQPLESMNTIGEVYFHFTEEHPANPGYVHPSINDIYLYDEHRDSYAKITMVEGIRKAHIWDASGYSKRLVAYLKNQNDLLKKGIAKAHYQYPISRDDDELYLPLFIGNLDKSLFGEKHLTNAVSSMVKRASYSKDGGNMLIADSAERFKNVDRLRETIERAPYNEAYFAEVARLNAPRSVVQTSSGPVFKGMPTPAMRVTAYQMKGPITEWAPNPYGGMDVPIDTQRFGMPAGMFSSAGLSTLAGTKSHPLSAEAHEAYTFARITGEAVHAMLAQSALFSNAEMPPNLPVNDIVQHVLTAWYGPRVPLFLAAPDSVIRASAVEDIELEARQTYKDTIEIVPGLYMRVSNDVKKAIDARDPIEETWTILKALTEITETTIPAEEIKTLLSWANGMLRNAILNWKGGSKDADIITLICKTFIYLNSIATRPEQSKAINAVVRPKVKGNVELVNEINGHAEKVAFVLKPALVEAFRKKLLADASNTNDQSTLALFEAYEKLREAVSKIYSANKGIFSGKTFLVVAGTRDWDGALKLEEETSIAPDLRNAYMEALVSFNAVNNTAPNAFVTIEGINKPTGRENDGRAFTSESSISSARFFRCPMFFSHELLVSAARKKVSWILPADQNVNFIAPVPLTQLGAVAAKASSMPHYELSRNNIDTRVSKWQDVPTLSRVALLSKAYHGSSSGSNDASASFGVMSAGPIGDAMDIDDTYGGSSKNARRHTQQEDVSSGGVAAPFREFLRGPMSANLKMAVNMFTYQPLHRLIAVAFLTTRHDLLHSIISMTTGGLSLPFEQWDFRLFSRHMMGSLFMMEAGLASGANFYNGAKYTVSHDGTTDMWQTRVVITTDAIPINVENHVLIPNVQAREYLGGHGNLIGTTVEEFDETKQGMSRASIIVCIVPSGSHVEACSPISFINSVPGRVIAGSSEYVPVDESGQNFPGADYYGHYVYRALFEDENLLTDYSTKPIEDKLTFAGDTKGMNHLAFFGYTIRYDYISGFFSREFMGDGQRAGRKFNAPGAKDYLNGSAEYLLNDRVASDYHLY